MEEGNREEDINSLLNRLKSKMRNLDDDLNMVRESTKETNGVQQKSFANILSSEKVPTKVNFRIVDVKHVQITELRNDILVEGAAVAIPIEAVEEVSARFENTLYRYFIGDRLAFPIVENYVKNTWAKFGLKRIMLDEDFFLFQFESLKRVWKR